MSELLVQVVKIESIKPHPNADRLEISRAGGWDIVTGKDNYKVGDLVVHVPPDAMLSRPLAEKWGVDPYLVWKKNSALGRVKAACLRGVTSYGFLAPNDTNSEVGIDLREHYEIEKYEPPPPPIGMQAGQMAREHPLFHRYTDIQNLRNFPDKLNYGEPLVVTEKLHGTQSRVGWVQEPESERFECVVGTHRTQRKLDDCGIYGLPFERYQDALLKLFDWAFQATGQEPLGLQSLIVYGEIFGCGVQDLHYGAKTEKDYRVFDIAINGEYMPWAAMKYVCDEAGLPTVPVLTAGILDLEELCTLAEGNTTLNDTHIREGIVVRPMCQELTWSKGIEDPNPKRMIFKVISGSYLTRKNGTEYH
jgi:RNA ligase (TIGR02306 family)